jgi:diguanylate cyclase (GGDEF)-like protein
MATSDQLTGLPNRHLLDQVLARTMRQALIDKTPLSLILLDLDHFKRINDSYGHAVGDVALRQLADIIRSQVRSTDIPARYGGEEFVIVLPGVDQVLALRIARRLRATVATRLWPAVLGAAAELSPARLPGTIRLTARIGVVSLQELGVRTPEEFLQAADAATYRAKQTGRNRVSRVPAPSSNGHTPDTAPDEAGTGLEEENSRLVAAIEWFNAELSPSHPPLPGHLLQVMDAQAVGWMRWQAPGAPCLIASAGTSAEGALKISQQLPWEAAPTVPGGCNRRLVSASLDGLEVMAGDRRLETALAMAAVDSEGRLTGAVWVAWDRPVTPSPSQRFILARLAGALGLELEIERLKHGDRVRADSPVSR